MRHSKQDIGKNRERLEQLRDEIYADYRRKTPNSSAMFDRARKVLPGGVSGNLRYFAPYPLYMTNGQGSKTYDVDGNEYIDCFNCNGPLLLGHNHPSVVAAADAVKGDGALLFNPPAMVECAELVTQVVPCAERVRFLNTGTEATTAACRYARGYTGKNKILKFFGHYHGQHDPFLCGINNSTAALSDGVPKDVLSSTLILPYGDIEAVAGSLANDKDIAAVILDPAMHAGGLWGSDPAGLRDLRQLTEKQGVLLIFDEVITGCRLALGGAQEYYGVTPDLVVMAKALTAGEKLSLVAGKEKVMRVVDPESGPDDPRVFQSGTYNDGSVALSVTIAALKTYKKLSEQGEYQRLAEKAQRLRNGLADAFEKRGICCQVNRVASMLSLFISPEPVSFKSAQTLDDLDVIALELFFHGLINEGVFFNIPTSDHIYLSFAHTDQDIDRILEKVELVLDRFNFESIFK